MGVVVDLWRGGGGGGWDRGEEEEEELGLVRGQLRGEGIEAR